MKPTQLKIRTCLVPDFPLELFQIFQNLFDEVLSTESQLSAESGAQDLEFENVDIAFLSSTEYVNLEESEKSEYELIPVAPVFSIRNDGGAFLESRAEVIVAREKSEAFKTFDDLRGHRWAVTDSECISSYSGVLGELRRMGHNANFFGSFLHTKSQRDVIVSILNKEADAGAVESSVLEIFGRQNPCAAHEISVLKSWGPYAPNAIVVRRRLAEEVKNKIVQALLKLSSDRLEFVDRFGKFGITGFRSFDPELFSTTSRFLDAGSREQLYPAYY